MFTPLGTTPIDWWWYNEDATATAAKNVSRKAASNFFSGIDYAGAQFTYLMTSADEPTGYSGETITSSAPKARVFAMRRADKKAAYLWVQQRDYTWQNGGSTPSTITPSITIGNLLDKSYKVEVWDTHAVSNQIVSTQDLTPSSGLLTITLPSMNNDTAVKIEEAAGVTSPAPTVTINQAVGQTDPTSTSPINYTVVFSESVSDFATGDVTLSGTAGATTATVTGSGTTYTVAVSGMTGSGAVIASVNAGVAHNSENTANTASTSSDHTVTYTASVAGPTLTSITISDVLGYTSDSTPNIALSSSGSPTYVAFSCNNGTNWSSWIAYAATISSFDITSGATGCSASNGTKVIYAKLKDASNNESTTKSDSTYYDTTAPSVPGLPVTTSPTSNNLPTWQWTASTDAGAGLTSPAYLIQWSTDNTFTTGVSSAPSAATIYTQVATLANGTWYARVKATDGVGNASAYSGVGSVVITGSSFTISSAKAVPSKTTVVITWTTGDAASSQIDYGKNASYGLTTLESDTSTRVLSHTQTIQSLSKCTTYHYRVKGSNDALGVAVGSDQSFKTTGCPSKSSHKSSSHHSSSHKSKSSSSSVSGPITLTKVNSVTIYPVLTSVSAPWLTYYSSSANPWFYGTGTVNGTNVTVYTWPNIEVCKAVVSGGVWGCLPKTNMIIKTHRIDIKYGSKLLPPFNLRIGGYTYAPAVKSAQTPFGSIINGQVKGVSDSKPIDSLIDTFKALFGF